MDEDVFQVPVGEVSSRTATKTRPTCFDEDHRALHVEDPRLSFHRVAPIPDQDLARPLAADGACASPHSRRRVAGPTSVTFSTNLVLSGDPPPDEFPEVGNRFRPAPGGSGEGPADPFRSCRLSQGGVGAIFQWRQTRHGHLPGPPQGLTARVPRTPGIQLRLPSPQRPMDTDRPRDEPRERAWRPRGEIAMSVSPTRHANRRYRRASWTRGSTPTRPCRSSPSHSPVKRTQPPRGT